MVTFSFGTLRLAVSHTSITLFQSKQMPSTLFRTGTIHVSNSCSFYINTVHVRFNCLIGMYTELKTVFQIRTHTEKTVTFPLFSNTTIHSVSEPYISFYSSAMQGNRYSHNSVFPVLVDTCKRPWIT